MRTLSRFLLATAFTGLLLSCGRDTLGPNDEVGLASAASMDRVEPANQRWVSEYFPPLVAQSYGLRTYRCTFECDGEEEFTSKILGEETVPYQTGELTGVNLWFYTEENVLYVDKKRLYVLSEGDYYVSTDCDLTAPPPQAELGSFVDGMILDKAGTFSKVNKDDPDDCREIVTPAVDGSVDSGITLMQIQDVRVGGKKYNNALLMWEIEPYLAFQGFDVAGGEYLEQELGITLPTGADTEGAAIDDLLIFGFHEGILALVDVGNSDGGIGEIWELVSIERSPTPSAFGSKFVFQSARGGNAEIYAMNADGSGQTRLTNDSDFERRPRWSPNGNRIAFARWHDGDWDIWVMNEDGSGQTNLTNSPGVDYRPGWSPDGREIAFRSDRKGNAEIYVMNADGSEVTRLTEDPAYDGAPSFSPDGSKIVFHSDRGGDLDIYVMNADGSGVERLTSDPASDGAPRWSPDGKQIAFRSDRDGDDEIWVMNVDGSGKTNLTSNTDIGDYFPSWSPNGRMIAFGSNRDGNSEIYVMNADGSRQTRLTDNAATDREQDWVSGMCKVCR